MAYKMTKRGSMDNEITYEFFCDTMEDLAKIQPKQINLGSVAIVLEGESNGVEAYIADSQKQWIAIFINNNESGNDEEEEGGDEPSEPKITCVFGEPEFNEQEPYQFQAQHIYAKIENYEVNNPGVYVFLLDFEQEVYDAIIPGEELNAEEYLDYGRDMTENTNPEYSEYQYCISELFSYEGLRYGIVLVDDYDEEKGTIRAIAKTQLVKPLWTVEISNASATYFPLSSKAGITANLNRHLVLVNDGGETEQVGVSPSSKEVGTDVTDDADVAYYPYDTIITSDGVDVGGIEGYAPSDKLYLVTVVNTFDMVTFDPVKIVTACSEEITIPAQAEG